MGPGSKPWVLRASWAARVSVIATRSSERRVLPVILSFTRWALSLIVSLVSTAFSLTSAAEAGLRAHVALSASAQARGMNLCMVHLLGLVNCKTCTSDGGPGSSLNRAPAAARSGPEAVFFCGVGGEGEAVAGLSAMVKWPFSQLYDRISSARKWRYATGKPTHGKETHAESTHLVAHRRAGNRDHRGGGRAGADYRGPEGSLCARDGDQSEPGHVQPERGRTRDGEGRAQRRHPAQDAQGRSANVRAEAPGAAALADGGRRGRGKEGGAGLPGEGRHRAGGDQDGLRPDHQAPHPRQGPVAETHGQGQGALSGDADRRERLRQLGPAGRAGDVSAQRRHQVLERGVAADEGRREEPDHLSRRPGVRRAWRAPAHQAGRDARLRDRVAGHRAVGTDIHGRKRCRATRTIAPRKTWVTSSHSSTST